MTDISDFQVPPPVQGIDVFKTSSGPILTETYWGFTVRNTVNLSSWLILGQMVSFLFGAAFIAAAFGLWAVPSAIAHAETLSLRFGISCMFGALGYVLISFANQGRTVDLQFDLNLGEIRAVVPNRSGSSRLVSQYGFDAFDEMNISGGTDGLVALTLQTSRGEGALVVAQGTEPQIGALYARLDRDLLRADCKRSRPAIRPTFN